MHKKLALRPATPDDATFIARMVLEALHYDMFAQELTPENQKLWEMLVPICTQKNTLYSYENTHIALLDQQPAGIVVAYDGKRYEELRKHTFPQGVTFDGTNASTMQNETQAGEYYIDSLAVLPEARGSGIGRALLKVAIVNAKCAELLPTLLVAPNNDGAKRLYYSIGFAHDGEVFAFGQTFWRLVCQ